MAEVVKKLKLVRRPASVPTFTFSAEQQAVIAHRGSPLVVFGGAGSGKTTTLIESVIARVKDGVDPNSILIITYGRERASDLRDAIARRAGSTSFEPLARTFHSLAFSILNEKLAPENLRYVLISGAEQDAAIKAMLQNPHVTIPWHSELKGALETRGFVREVRDLILRATELGLTPKDLQVLAKTLGEKYWDGAAHFWSSYYGASELQSATVGEGLVRIDPSAIIHEALDFLRADKKRLQYFRERFTTIVIDEFQESDKSQRELLRILAGSETLIFADPDSAVGRFRGADPDGVVRDLDNLQNFPTAKMLLTKNFRSNADLSTLSDGIASHLHSQSLTRPKVPSSFPLRIDPATQAIQLAKLASPSESANYIAHAFRSAHLKDGVPWSGMAVILRSPGQEIQALQRAFSQNSIPISIDATALALADNPAIKPLLAVAQIALRSKPLVASDWPMLEEILLSEFGGADALQLRQIRLALTKVRTDHRSSTEMMIDALTEKSAELPWEEILPIKRINDLITAAKKSLRTSNDISDLLWAVWNCAVDYDGRKMAEVWRDRAFKGGNKGAAADRDLDAVIQLFESARRFTERNQSAQPQLFIDQIIGERILSDSITSTAQREEVVSVMTVHSAKGLEWDFVAITGLQEGNWPNLKERGSLLGSERLVESQRTGLTSLNEILAATSSGLIEDERRLLYVAITRAKKRLLITAFQEEDSQPSRYFEELYESVHGENSDEFQSAPPRSLTNQSLVATLRREVMDGSEFAASLLRTIADAGIQSADPENWLGVRPMSSDLPVVAPSEKVYVSPSSLASFDDCGLKWFLERAGAQDGDSTAQLLGVAIHFIAKQIHKNPDLTLAEGIAQLTEAWPVVDQNVGWYKSVQLKEAQNMLTRFFEWHSANERKLILVEEKFEVEFGRAILKGSVDRLERDEISGEYFVVDLKTGSPSTKKQAEENKQLSAYQLAVVKEGFKDLPGELRTSGAGLLFLKKETKKNETIDQPSINVEVVEAEVKEAAEGMAAATFTAVINDRCRTCAIKTLCPLQSRGRSVIEE